MKIVRNFKLEGICDGKESKIVTVKKDAGFNLEVKMLNETYFKIIGTINKNDLSLKIIDNNGNIILQQDTEIKEYKKRGRKKVAEEDVIPLSDRGDPLAQWVKMLMLKEQGLIEFKITPEEIAENIKRKRLTF